jgi:hypothetical protein
MRAMKKRMVALNYLVSNACLACYATPPAQLVGPQELVYFSSNIALATVTRVVPRDDGSADFVFMVEKRLLGAGDSTFILNGHALPGDTADGSFGDHVDDKFWQRGGGRLHNDTDCKIHPSFVAGRSYLVFLDQPVSRRSFEQIDSTGRAGPAADKWLGFVEQKLQAKTSR